jgi:putative transposase
LLPDHLHCIWTLPEQDHDYPTRWKKIKTLFSKSYLKGGGTTGEVSQSMTNKGEVGIWQRRYWEHTIYDEKDLDHHIEYIHYNPIKHGLVESTLDWPWSSFHRYVNMGLFPEEWGSGYKEKIDTRLVGE